MTDNEQRIRDLEMIIASLENNGAFNLVLQDKKKSIEFCDACWHTIDANKHPEKLLELKYEKFSAENFVNTIETYKQELETLKQNEEGQGYVDDD